MSAWNPAANGGVLALAVSGTRVYVGGKFTRIGGQPRAYIAALDTRSGAAKAWNPRAHFVPCNSRITGTAGCDVGPAVLALAVTRSHVYVGGVFTRIGGKPRGYIAALDPRTGAATAWNPNADDYVAALAVSGPTIYVGGYFNDIGRRFRGASPRFPPAAVDRVRGTPTSFTVWVQSQFLVRCVFVGGGFDSVGASSREGFAAFG